MIQLHDDLVKILTIEIAELPKGFMEELEGIISPTYEDTSWGLQEHLYNDEKIYGLYESEVTGIEEVQELMKKTGAAYVRFVNP